MKKLILSLAIATIAVGVQAGAGKSDKPADASCCAKSQTSCCSGKSASSCNGSKVVMSPKAAEQARKS